VTDSTDEAAIALARAAVEQAAPEELPLFPAASEAYREGKDLTAESGDEMLGFGVDAAVVLLTPVALTVAKDVLGFLREQLAKQAAKHGESMIDRLVDRLLRRDDETPAAEPVAAELTDEQLDQVRDLALQKARQLKLPDAKAKLLADSLVGSLATA
jgi:hypothetical protein